MNLTDYLRILIHRGWILILLAVITGSTAYLVSREQTPEYRASQKVVIQPTRPDLGLSEASIRLLEPLVAIINSEEIAQQIIDDLRLDMTAGELKGSATIAADQLRMIIQIDVESTDQDVARAAARAWGEKLQAYRDEKNQEVNREDRVEAILSDFPTVSQIAPRPLLNGIAGGILGLIIGGLVIFALEFVESAIVRRREDLEGNLQIPVLSTIPHAES